ncbi:MAG TPA: ion channel [Candidatus Limnocylindria bacterium]|nr:ion channel [Candidatus Limnocylindria bacterium]
MVKVEQHARSDEPEAPQWVEWTMLALAALMVPIVLIQESTDDLTAARSAEIAGAIIWMAFVAEYLWLLSRARDRRGFVRAHWFDLAIIVASPPIFVPDEFEAFRALRVVRLVRAVAAVGRAQHMLRRHLRRDSLPYLVLLSLLVVFLGGLAIHALEPDRATSIGDGIWWAAATLSTVGYGDIAPASFWGRVLAAAIMLVGIGTFAALTAAVASFFVEADTSDESVSLSKMEREITQIREELASLRQDLAARPRGD